MISRFLIAALALSILPAVSAHAQADEAAPPVSEAIPSEPAEGNPENTGAAPESATADEDGDATISGKGGLGLIVNRGNTNNENFNATLQLAVESTSWKHTFGIDALKTTEGETTVAERYLFTEKTDYTLNEHAYIFGALRYDDDRFSGFKYQASLTTGLGWRVIDSDRTLFELELGGGYKRSKLEIDDTNEKETIGRFGEQFRIQLTESTQFSQNLLTEWGDDQTISEFKAALNVAMNSRLAIQIGYTIKHTSNPPLDRKDTDRSTSVNLVYSF